MGRGARGTCEADAEWRGTDAVEEWVSLREGEEGEGEGGGRGEATGWSLPAAGRPVAVCGAGALGGATTDEGEVGVDEDVVGEVEGARELSAGAADEAVTTVAVGGGERVLSSSVTATVALALGSTSVALAVERAVLEGSAAELLSVEAEVEGAGAALLVCIASVDNEAPVVVDASGRAVYGSS